MLGERDAREILPAVSGSVTPSNGASAATFPTTEAELVKSEVDGLLERDKEALIVLQKKLQEIFKSPKSQPQAPASPLSVHTEVRGSEDTASRAMEFCQNPTGPTDRSESADVSSYTSPPQTAAPEKASAVKRPSLFGRLLGFTDPEASDSDEEREALAMEEEAERRRLAQEVQEMLAKEEARSRIKAAAEAELRELMELQDGGESRTQPSPAGKLLMIYTCNFHALSHLLLIYICKLHWNLKTAGNRLDRLKARLCLRKTGCFLKHPRSLLLPSPDGLRCWVGCWDSPLSRRAR